MPPSLRTPAAVIEGEGSKTVIISCTQGAARVGVLPGFSLHAALVLAPTLQVYERDIGKEQAALLRLAGTGYDFTPTVSLENPHSLLLEVEGSAHLFGGTTAVRHRAKATFRSAGFTTVTALAPTPMAALWLAHARQDVSVLQLDDVRSVLGRLPVHAVFKSADLLDSFDRLGVKQLVDLFRLPRDGVARRFGKEFLKTLDQATGDAVDLRVPWTVPKRARFNREMPGELIQIGHLMPYIQDMVAQLIADLRKHDTGVDRIKLAFKHWQQPPTTIVIGSAQPHRDEHRWNLLIDNKLSNLVLTAPVLDIALVSGRYMRYTAQSQDLLGISKAAGEHLSYLVDLLRARLGRTAVFGVETTLDARPEQAFRTVEPGVKSKGRSTSPSRPIHLLPVPVTLSSRADQLRYRGASLRLIKGPERIEGGWWSGETWIRDYYHAASSRGERLWVFHQDKQWYLHGLFS